MIKHDPTIMFKSLENNDMYYPTHDPFPIKEIDYQQYFHVHNQPRHPVRPNLITIGCHLFSSKTINEIKKSILEMHTMMEWLNANHIFIEADTLGHRAIRTIGYFFNIHPNITHCTSFKTNISEALDRVRMTKMEVLELAPEAADSYELDIEDEDDTFGPEHYKQLIRMNNTYLNSIATIPVIGLPDDALEVKIETRNSKNNLCYKTLKDIFLDNEWCCNIEPTKLAGKMLFITTKGDLDIGQQWLDENLPALFAIHLPKNPHFTPDPDNPIAKCKENDQATPTLQAYMDSLKHTIQPTTLASKNNMSKFAKPPATQNSQQILISYKQTLEKNLPKQNNTLKLNAKPDNNKKRRTNDNNSTKSTDNNTEITMASTQTATIADLKQEILAMLQQDMAKMIHRELAPMKTEMQKMADDNKSKMDQLTNALFLFQEQMRTQFEQLSHQIATINQTQPKPPPPMHGGGTY